MPAKKTKTKRKKKLTAPASQEAPLPGSEPQEATPTATESDHSRQEKESTQEQGNKIATFIRGVIDRAKAKVEQIEELSPQDKKELEELARLLERISSKPEVEALDGLLLEVQETIQKISSIILLGNLEVLELEDSDEEEEPADDERHHGLERVTETEEGYEGWDIVGWQDVDQEAHAPPLEGAALPAQVEPDVLTVSDGNSQAPGDPDQADDFLSEEENDPFFDGDAVDNLSFSFDALEPHGAAAPFAPII